MKTHPFLMQFTHYVERQKQYKDKFLIRKDGVVVPYNEILAKEPGFFLYELPEIKLEAKPQFDVDWAGKQDCIKFAKDNFGVDLPANKNLTYLRTRVRELCRS